VSSLIEVPDLIERLASCHSAKGHIRSGGARGELESASCAVTVAAHSKMITPQTGESTDDARGDQFAFQLSRVN
jgi:hypothetical protein